MPIVIYESSVDILVTQTRHTDENGNTNTYRFNGLGYLAHYTDALNRVSRFGYDAQGNLIEVVNAAGESANSGSPKINPEEWR